MLPRQAPLLRRRAELAVRPLKALAAAAVCVLIAGCGDDDSSYSPIEETELTITLYDGGSGEPGERAEVSCPGANAPQAACRAIEELPEDPAAPVPAGTPCTEIYGGPDVVTIEGTLQTEAIDARLTRENGCEIERFERFGPLLAALFPDYEPGL